MSYSNGGRSSLTMPLIKETLEEIAKKFNVSVETCERYCQFYDKSILPRIQKKYLAKLISVVEDMITEKIQSGIEKIRQEEDIAPNTRRYSIVLSDKLRRKNVKAFTLSLKYGAIITYNPENSEEDISMSIAHELGHLLIEYEIISGADAENHAELFAYFALNKENNAPVCVC